MLSFNKNRIERNQTLPDLAEVMKLQRNPKIMMMFFVIISYHALCKKCDKK